MEIKPTDKVLSRKTVLEIVKDQIFECDEAMEKWQNFEEVTRDSRYKINEIINFVDVDHRVTVWIKKRPWAQEWLVKHGFATEVVEFTPFTIEVRTKEEAANLYHRLNDNMFNQQYKGLNIFGYKTPFSYDNARRLFDSVFYEIEKQNGFK